MIERDITVCNKLGLHARAAAKLVHLANGYESEITLRRDDGRSASAKSIMAVMMLAAAQGSGLVIVTDGADEDAAADAIERLFAERFGEDE